MKARRLGGLLLVIGLTQAGPGRADDPTGLPPGLEGIGFEQRIGAALPRDGALVSETGEPAPVATLFGDRPLILAPVYYECPMLCSLVLEGLAKSVPLLGLEPGGDFDILAVSFDPGEGPAAARAARASLARRHALPDGAAGWHFLTGEEDTVRPLMDALGFRYRYRAQADEWAHAGGIAVLTPAGEIARYFYGIDYPPRDLRLALVEAARGELGSIVDQVMLFCLRYDPETGRYSAAVMTVVRTAGVLTVLGIASLLLVLRQRGAGARDRERSAESRG